MRAAAGDRDCHGARDHDYNKPAVDHNDDAGDDDYGTLNHDDDPRVDDDLAPGRVHHDDL